MAGVYIHIPFCRKACNYCDFHFSTSLGYKEELLKCIKEEIHIRKTELETPISSIYFGGGTPSILSENEIKELIEQCRNDYEVSKDAEITLEANPEDLTIDLIKGFARSGINRLSIGIQSFQDHILNWMNRSHTAEQAINCIKNAKDAGIINISADIIYGIPKSLNRNWDKEVLKLLELNIPHISAYNLTVEEKTALHKWVNEKKQVMPEQEACNLEYEALVKSLNHAGYEQYEVSNFSMDGFRSRHNSAYWDRAPYLGVGPSAHSFDGKRVRKWNVSNNIKYIKSINSGALNSSKEILSEIDIANELILLGTRTIFGVSVNKVLNYLNQQQKNVFLKQLEEFKKKNFIRIDKDHLFVDGNMRFISDYIARELIILP